MQCFTAFLWGKTGRKKGREGKGKRLISATSFPTATGQAGTDVKGKCSSPPAHLYGCCSETILSRLVGDAILYAGRCTHGFPLGPWPSRSPPPDQPYLDTLNLGKVMLFLMKMVNFSTSGNRAGLKNTSVGTCPQQGGKGLCVCWEVLHGGPWRWENEAHGRARCCCKGRENRAGPQGHVQSPGLLC